MKKPRKTARSKPASASLPGRSVFGANFPNSALFWACIALLVLVPLSFSASVYTKYSLPKFAVLIVGCSMLLVMLTFVLARFASSVNLNPLRSRLAKLVCFYFIAVAVSSIFGASPFVSLFGSHFNYMGLITRLCFFIFFIALIVAIGASERRLRATLWAMTATGFVVSMYAIAQSFGIDPFVSASTYTFASPTGPVIRVCATLGHSNYLGNFLLYTTPASAALAFTAVGWQRLFAAFATALSITSIAFSGTRGAWVGICAGIVTFALLELKSGAVNPIITRNRKAVILTAMISSAIIISIIAASPLSRSVAGRARALMSEGLASSGRLLLWRDSISMLPSSVLIGCGPEGFRKAFLGFKSEELAELSPKANNESSHNSYLDAAISFGLPGAILYIAIIALALKLLIRARRQAINQNRRIIITGLVSSFAAALAHNIFIFDQIATGFYFFAFVALAQAASNVFDETEATVNAHPPTPNAAQTGKSDSAKLKSGSDPQMRVNWVNRAISAAACVCVAAAVWYSTGLIKSDIAYKEIFNPAKPLDFNGLVKLGERVTSAPLPTGAYDYLFARAVDTFVRKLPAAANSTNQSQPAAVDIAAIRTEALNLAIRHTEKSLARTITPELNYLLLGTLAMASGDANRLRDAASEAVKWDPNNYHTRWLMAEAHLARGETVQAEREAKRSLALYALSPEAASALARARGKNPTDDSAIAEILVEQRNSRPKLEHSSEELIEIARGFSQAGRLPKARIKLMTAIDRANGPCPECHRELAAVYEKMGRYRDAIAEWETFIQQAPDRAMTEQIQARVETLKQKNNPK